MTKTLQVVLATLALPLALAAQERHYKVIDLGTLGGPNSGQVGLAKNLNHHGEAIAVSDTSFHDPNPSNCFNNDCFVAHAIRWNRGLVEDLGAPDGLDGKVNSSVPTWLADSGWIAGLSENGLIDPLTGSAEVRAILWNNRGHGFDLGTLGGNSSQALAVNNSGQVVGVALNTTPDDFSQFMFFLPAATQARAFLWQDGFMRDLGTLGGPDSEAQAINDRGQVVGFSFTDTSPNPFREVPTVHPFLWDKGEMIDLGTLGGTLAVPGGLSSPGGVNLNGGGQVIGTSTLAGDQLWHPFLWENGLLKDLGTLGGRNGEAWFISDSGYVAGRADVSPLNKSYHAFRWKDGRMIDLGVFPPCQSSIGLSVNSRGQVVGETEICPGGADGHAFVSHHGEEIVDLNALAVPGSELTLTSAVFINDRGEIAGAGVLPNGEQRGVLLIPCDDEHPHFEGCDYSLIEAADVRSYDKIPTANALTRQNTRSPAVLDPPRNRFIPRGRGSGQSPVPHE